MKRILSLILAAVMLLGVLSGCTPRSSGPVMEGDAYVLTIYRSRDSGMADGARDEAVKAAIEEKFYQDTGIKISLDVKLYTNEALTDIVDVNYGNKNKNIDAIIHYLSEDSGCAIMKYAKDPDATMNLDPLLEQYGQNILKYLQMNDDGNLADRAGYLNHDGTYERAVLTSYAKEGGFGILIRKDLMRDVMDVTGLDPEDYDVANDGYKSMTVSEFEAVMKAIKEDPENDVTIPVNGKPWDLNRVVATAFGVDSMSGYSLNSNGEYTLSTLTESWNKYVDLMYTWARDGIWENESNNTTDDQRLTNLVAGKCAAYLAYPTAEELIRVSRTFYAANTSGEELMVIAPFASEDENGNCLYNDDGSQVVNGNLKQNRAFYGMIIPYRSANYEILIKYMDWMYSNVENYELCLYGVKGEDWIEGEDYVYNGVTYKTWAYPDDKADEYLEKSPYNGKYMLLQNINISNRLSAHYNTVEKKWYTSLYSEFPVFGNEEIEGIWLPEASRDIALVLSELDSAYVDNIRAYAWVGRKYGDKTPTEQHEIFVADTLSRYQDTLNYLNEEFLKAKAYFAEKYAD